MHFNLCQNELNRRHKKRNCPDIGEKCGETVKRSYGRRSPELDGGPGDVVWPQNELPIPAVETPTIVEEDDENASMRISGFVIEISEILQQYAKHGDR